ncbi:hypothetical protein K1719_045980 [Acacia pycnantha]|nr:hypothetical protein K1719_045980 [Acacia pycnantha]
MAGLVKVACVVVMCVALVGAPLAKAITCGQVTSTVARPLASLTSRGAALLPPVAATVLGPSLGRLTPPLTSRPSATASSQPPVKSLATMIGTLRPFLLCAGSTSPTRSAPPPTVPASGSKCHGMIMRRTATRIKEDHLSIGLKLYESSFNCVFMNDSICLI